MVRTLQGERRVNGLARPGLARPRRPRPGLARVGWNGRD
jgi:hypothetical protein